MKVQHFFFRSDGQHGRVDYDPNTNAFLNAKKMQIDRHNKNGKALKSFAPSDIRLPAQKDIMHLVPQNHILLVLTIQLLVSVQVQVMEMKSLKSLVVPLVLT